MKQSFTSLTWLAACLALVLGWSGAGIANAQATAMDTCRGFDACDDVATDFIGKSALLLENELYVEAAQHLYPVLLTNRVSPLMQTATRNQFSTILETAGLYELAAEQKDIANSTTSAPSSEGLLDRARLLSKVEEMEDETLAAYADATRLALQAANMGTIDAIISDYRALGQSGLAARLQAQRSEAAGRASLACDLAQCKSRAYVDTRAVEPVVPVYPPRALAAGDSADCRVRMNVTEAGEPVDLTAECTDPQFVESALAAAAQTVFVPRFTNGWPEPRYNVILPFTFAVD